MYVLPNSLPAGASVGSGTALQAESPRGVIETFWLHCVAGFDSATQQKREKVEVKESRNRPGVAQRVPGGLGSQISMTFGT